jgi:hypothetical protein
MKFDPGKAVDLIPTEMLATIKLVNISTRCWCNKVHYMPSLTTEKICTCGRKVAFSRTLKIHVMIYDALVRKEAKAMLKKIQAGSH